MNIFLTETDEYYPLVKCPDKNAKLHMKLKFVLLSEITDNTELMRWKVIFSIKLYSFVIIINFIWIFCSMTTDTSKADISTLNESFQVAGDVTFSNLTASMGIRDKRKENRSI